MRAAGVGPGVVALAMGLGAAVLPAQAQDPLKTLPLNYRVVFENSAVTVIHAHYGAHEKIPVHDHPSVATVFVYLNDAGAVRLDHTGEASVMRPPTVKGSYRVAPGLAETHSIENPGDTDSEFLRVELKHVALEMPEPFRGRAPKALTQSADTMEFANPAVQVERIVCVGQAPCAVKASPSASLLVVFTPTTLTAGAAGAKQTMKDGDVRWVAAEESDTVVSAGAEPAHLLRILLPLAAK